MFSPRVLHVRLFDCKPFHSLLEILSATEISADKIGFPADASPFADRRGKEIAIFLVLLDTAVSFTLFCCFQFNYSFLIFFCLSFGKDETKRKRIGLLFRIFPFAFRQGQRSCSVLPLTESAFSFKLRRRKTKVFG